ncbi:hypothetical protein [Saccharothrix luteola]|uniref:hypothetical protein n=1 Tax=Saccharothrix luteola TaxID=2893018 RepID=UPI001E4580D7|nr:hypothetical protein [Saccharothrix luteola]MCC8248231.1 hypothetical protein [Saccharothrix luteola]
MATRTQRHSLVDEGSGDQPQSMIQRITVGIIPKVWDELLQLMTSTRFNRTDVVNRAISIYWLIEMNKRSGKELIFRDPETGREQVVEIV